jgi:hypothetical protein
VAKLTSLITLLSIVPDSLEYALWLVSKKYDAEIHIEEFIIKWFWKKYLVILAGIVEIFSNLGIKNIFKIIKNITVR